jgi:hypothetical protein
MASAPTGNDIQAADLLALARFDDDGAPPALGPEALLIAKPGAPASGSRS